MSAGESCQAPEVLEHGTDPGERDDRPHQQLGKPAALPQIPDPAPEREGEFDTLRETFLCMVTDPEVNRTLRVLGRMLFDLALESRGNWPDHPGSLSYWEVRAALGDMRYLQYQLQRVGLEPWNCVLTPDEVLVCVGAGAEAKAVAGIARRLERLLASHEHLGKALRESPEETEAEELGLAATGVEPGRQDRAVWAIRNDGRAWRGEEVRQRYDLMPQKLEMIEGKLLWDDDERRTLLGLLLENLGADEAVRLGSPEVWRTAVARLPAGGA